MEAFAALTTELSGSQASGSDRTTDVEVSKRMRRTDSMSPTEKSNIQDERHTLAKTSFVREHRRPGNHRDRSLFPPGRSRESIRADSRLPRWCPLPRFRGGPHPGREQISKRSRVAHDSNHHGFGGVREFTLPGDIGDHTRQHPGRSNGGSALVVTGVLSVYYVVCYRQLPHK